MQTNYIVTHAFLLFCLEAIYLPLVLVYVKVQTNCLNRLSEKETFVALTFPVEIKAFLI